MDAVEQREKDIAAGVVKVKTKAKDKDKSSKKKKLGLASDNLPSKDAIRIEPKYDDILKKVEKLNTAKENKGKRLAVRMNVAKRNLFFHMLTSSLI